MSDTEVSEAASETLETKAPAETEQPSESESRARRMGWHPKNEYDASGRDPSKWVEAEEFIKRGEEQLPVIKERYRKLERQYEGLEGKLTEGNKLLQDLVKHQAEREKKAVEKAIKGLEAKRDEATLNGDVAQVRAISAEINEQEASLANAPKIESRADKADVPPEINAWVQENQWFDSDPIARGAAIAAYGKLTGDKSMTETQRLAKVRAEVAKRFPEHFTNANRNKAPSVEGGGNAPRRANGKSWDDIPAEHRGLAERLIKQGAVKDRAAYTKSYFE